MGTDKVTGGKMDVAHYDRPIHVGVCEAARGLGSLLCVLIGRLKLGSNGGVPVSVDVRDCPGEVPDPEVVIHRSNVPKIE